MNNSGERLSSRVDSPARTAVSGPGAGPAASAAVSARQTAVIYGTVAAAIIVALSPALFFSFGYHNDYQQWAYDSYSCCMQYPETNMLIDIGRYFGAFAQNLQASTIHTLDDLWWWRLIGILSVAGLASYYLHIVSLRRPPTWQNACVSVAVFTLPTMQFQAIWVAMYVFWTPPMLLSLAAADLLVRATRSGIPIQLSGHRIFLRQSALWHFAGLTLLAFVAVLAACFFYPMSATVLLVPAAHLLLSENGKQFRQMAVVAVVVLGSALVSLFVIHKFIVLPLLSNVPYLGEYGYTLTGSLLAEVPERLRFYIWEGAYLWLTLEIPLFPKLVVAVSVIATVYSMFRVFRGSINKGELLNVMMACGLFVAAVGPVLIVSQFSVTYRVRLAMNGIELLILFWLLRQLPIGSLRLASFLATFGVGCSFVGVYGTSAAAQAEHVLYSESVAHVASQDFHSIAIISPLCCKIQAFGWPLRVDFGVLTPAPGIFDLLIGPRYKGQTAFSVTDLVLPSSPTLLSEIESNKKKVPLAIEENAIVIDRAPLLGAPSFNDVLSKLATVSARPRNTRPGVRYGPANAVDGLAKTFWEIADVPFPIALELEFPTAHTLVGYSLSTVEATRRMPSSWELCVSSDRSHWYRLDEANEGRPWNNDETRNYKVAQTSGVTGIKLVVKATDDNSILRLYEFRPEFTTLPTSTSDREIAQDVSALRPNACAKAGEDAGIPHLLYAYKDYNVIQVGKLYVGVAQDLGPMDVRDVLLNTVPRPPSEKFIIAEDASSLEAAIDAIANSLRKLQLRMKRAHPAGAVSSAVIISLASQEHCASTRAAASGAMAVAPKVGSPTMRF